jgi:glycosyltransferase involved in cell wall biosynthesis
VITSKYLFQLQSTKKIKVILISTVTPGPNSAGQLVLQRHLVDEPEVELQIFRTEPYIRGLRKFARRLLGRLSRTKLRPFCQDVLAVWRSRWLDAELPAPKNTEMPVIVVTVAHEEACYAAMRYAKRHNLPLVTFFHDWWPDIPKVHKPFRSVLERSFRRLYRESSLALCVSPGMKKALGPHANTKVLLPIPAEAGSSTELSAGEIRLPFRLLYSGNLGEYGAMLIEALELFKDHENIRLEVRGADPGWPESFKEEMSARGLLLPFAPRKEFDSWIKKADAFLITQSFEEKHSRLMQTNFPSKLVEFAQFGKPLILWAPSNASGPKWAIESGQGMVVDDKNPEQLRQALEILCEDTAEQERLSAAAKDAAAACFDPKRIQSNFMDWLHEIAIKSP